MIEKMRVSRPVSGSPSTEVGQVRKSTSDKFNLYVSYDDIMEAGDYLASCTLTATKVSDGSDVAATILANSGGPPAAALTLAGTATSGSTTTLVDTTKNFAALGVLVGDRFLNLTKGWVATVKRVFKTTNLNDSLEFSIQATAVAASDAYKFFFAGATIQAGSDQTIYNINWLATTQNGHIYRDTAILNVRDKID